MADDLPLPPLGPVLDWPTVAAHRRGDTAEALYTAAQRRMHTDPLFAARVTLARRILDSVHHGLPDSQDRGWARMGAAVALLVAERPELITGEPDRRRPAVDVLAEAVARRVPGAMPLSAIHEAAGHLLGALTDAGWDLIRRADRFASLDHPGTVAVRIPFRGRCAICRGPVERTVDGTTTEVLIGPWRHPGQVDGDGHTPAGVEPV